MNPSDGFNIFNDSKFNGIDKINSCCNNNLSTTNKFIRVLKDFSFAQDIYVKSLVKVNTNLYQLCTDKSDFLNPILSFYSVTFCVFTNVQNEYEHAINKIIKSLISSCDEKNGIFGKIFSTTQLNIISEFKNSELQLSKAKQKYFSLYQVYDNGNNTENEKNEKALKRAKEIYHSSVVNYNKSRLTYLQVLEEGFNLLKTHNFEHLENIRKITKTFGNALAKLVFDMKESVNSLKQFYRTFDKEEIFQLWAESNKTISDSNNDAYPEAVLEIPDSTNKINENQLIDMSPITPPNRSSTPPGKTVKRNVEARKMSHNVTSSGYNVTDQDIPDSINQDLTGYIKNNEKPSIQTIKNSKKKRSIFSSLMKFKSTSNLQDEDDKSVENEFEENWQSRSNLNTNVLVDAEGYIIREPIDDTRKLSGSSSSNSSFENRMKPLKKLNIKPINEIPKPPDTDSELMHVALQLPLPRREKNKIDVTKRISNLQRSVLPVSSFMKDKLYRRSMSVSELESMKNNLESVVDNETENSVNIPLNNEENVNIPMACALTEIVTTDIIKNKTIIQGQIIIAFPLSFKQFLQATPIQRLPNTISFNFIDKSHQITSAQITNQLEEMAKLERIDNNLYSIAINMGYLKKCLSNESLSKVKFQISNRISIPIFEYFAPFNNVQEKLIKCQARWAIFQVPNIQFDFTLTSAWFEINKPTIVELKLLTEGVIEDIYSKEILKIEKLNNQCWKIHYEKSDNRISVKIKTMNSKLVKLRMNYEFIFEKLSLIKPDFSLNKTDNLSSLNLSISLLHYRTMSTGNFSELFEYKIS